MVYTLHMGYAQQIRDIAIDKVLKQGLKMSVVARFIGADRHTVEDWIKMAKGNISRSVRPKDRSSDKTKVITDFVDKNSDMSLKEMEKELGFSDTNIAYHLKKAGYSLKKSRKGSGIWVSQIEASP
jgi:transposase